MKTGAKQIYYFFIVVTSFLLFHIKGVSQDSLLNELGKPNSDSNRIKIYLKLAELKKDHADSVVKYINGALVIAEKTKSNKWIVESYRLLTAWNPVNNDSETGAIAF